MEQAAMKNRWPIIFLLPLAVVVPPILGIMLVIGLPQTPSAKASLPGMTIWPLATLALIIFAARRAVPGWERAIFVLTALAVTTVCWLMFAVAMMAP